MIGLSLEFRKAISRCLDADKRGDRVRPGKVRVSLAIGGRDGVKSRFLA